MSFVSDLEIAKKQQSNGYMLDRKLIERQMSSTISEFQKFSYSRENYKFCKERGLYTIEYKSTREIKRFILARRCANLADRISDVMYESQQNKWDNILFRSRNRNRRLIEPVKFLYDDEVMERIICSSIIRGDIR
jgi:hypothetical protein